MEYQILNSDAIYKQQLSSKTEAVLRAAIADTTPRPQRRITIPREEWEGKVGDSTKHSPL